MLEDTYKKIEHQNRTLLQRMSNIMENPSRTTDNRNRRYGQVSRSLNLQRRRENLDRITCDNAHLLHRLQSMEPYYKVEEWEKDFERSEKIMRHMMEFDPPSPSAIPAAARRGGNGGSKTSSPQRNRSSPRRTKQTKHGSTHARSPQRLKRLSKKDRSRVTPIPTDDEVVEIFRFPSLALRGVGVPDSAWDISLFDSRAKVTQDAGEGSEPAEATVLVLRGNKVTRTAVATLALDEESIDKIIAGSEELCEAFDAVRAGTRAYRALGLVQGDTHLTTQLANLLLGRLRVTPQLKFTLEFDGETENDGGNVQPVEDTTESEVTESKQDSDEEDERMEEDAARLIQAQVRGNLARKKQSAENPENNGADEEGTAMQAESIEDEKSSSEASAKGVAASAEADASIDSGDSGPAADAECNDSDGVADVIVADDRKAQNEESGTGAKPNDNEPAKSAENPEVTSEAETVEVTAQHDASAAVATGDSPNAEGNSKSEATAEEHSTDSSAVREEKSSDDN